MLLEPISKEDKRMKISVCGKGGEYVLEHRIYEFGE
jgi:hypothetical protein